MSVYCMNNRAGVSGDERLTRPVRKSASRAVTLTHVIPAFSLSIVNHPLIEATMRVPDMTQPHSAHDNQRQRDDRKSERNTKEEKEK